jgi:uncharacterized membrane protein YgdD (TMEM256/DUF423 family)
MRRTGLVIAGVLGLTGVALGAFGAHALDATGPAKEWWDTAAQYHLLHAIAAGIAALAADRGGRAAKLAVLLFTAGVLLFSGSLYLMSLTDLRTLGMVTPLGGLAFLAGWTALIVAGIRKA